MQAGNRKIIRMLQANIKRINREQTSKGYKQYEVRQNGRLARRGRNHRHHDDNMKVLSFSVSSTRSWTHMARTAWSELETTTGEAGHCQSGHVLMLRHVATVVFQDMVLFRSLLNEPQCQEPDFYLIITCLYLLSSTYSNPLLIFWHPSSSMVAFSSFPCQKPLRFGDFGRSCPEA